MSLVQELNWCMNAIKVPEPKVPARVIDVLATMKIGKQYSRAQIHDMRPFECSRFTVTYMMGQAVDAGLAEVEKMLWPPGNARKSLIYTRLK